jgi:hypothetical protein
MVDDLNNKMYYSSLNVKNKILYVFSFLLFFLLTRQVPFDSFSYLMNLSLVGLIIFSISNIAKKIYGKFDFLVLIIFSFLTIQFFYSLILMNQLSNVSRFYLIFGFLTISYYIILPKKTISIFLYLSVLQAILILIFSIFLSSFFTIDDYLPLRAFFLEKGWGDVFTYDGWFYKIQIKGNALLPFAFFITFFYKLKYRIIIRLILFIGCLVAGNIAFLISIFIFLAIYYLKTDKIEVFYRRFFLLFIFIIISSVPIYKNFIEETLERKNVASLPLRTEQINLLMNDLAEKDIYIYIGRGIGHTIEKISSNRDYRGNVYFELQTFYVLNQLGILGFSLFLFYNIFISIKLYSKWLILCYVCYVLYAFTNPYIFDTNHIVVILILNTLRNNET